MKIYHYDLQGIYVGQGFADESPLEPGVWLVPAQATLVEPPLPIPQGSYAEFNGTSWAIKSIPGPTPEQILSSQSQKLQSLISECNLQKAALANRISTLKDAIELDMATPEEVAEKPVREAQLLEWKRYGVLLGRVTGQEGWPPDAEWPVKPIDGMDLSVSSIAPGSDHSQ